MYVGAGIELPALIAKKWEFITKSGVLPRMHESDHTCRIRNVNFTHDVSRPPVTVPHRRLGAQDVAQVMEGNYGITEVIGCCLVSTS